MHSVAGKAGDVILIHTDITDWSAATVSFLTSAVTTFNARVGAVTLQGTDVTTALGYTPYDAANPASYQTASQVASTVSGAVAAYVPLSQRAAVNGVATLDATGVVPTTQLPGAATGTLSYKGGWNASTNTPVMASGALAGGVLQPAGNYYLVTVGATTAAIDGITTWVAGDWISSNGTVWQRVQNSTSPYLPLTGGALTGTLFYPDGSSDGAGTPMIPDLAWWRRDTAGNIVQAHDTTGATLMQSLTVYGATTLTGTSTIVGTATFTAAPTLPGINFAVGDAIQRPSVDPPDLARYWRDTAGNIVAAIDSQGTFVVQSLQVLGTASIPGAGGGGTSGAPADALDITTPAYGGVGDGNDDVFLGAWTANSTTLSIIKYSGAITWSGTTLTLSGIDNASGPGFDANCIGMNVYIGATDASGVAQTVQITARTSASAVTVSASPTGAVATANVTWPAFVASDVGKAIRVDGGCVSIIRQAYASGLCPYLGTIASVVSGASVTVTNSIAPNLTSANNGRPTRVSWGTDNSTAYKNATADQATTGAKYVWHPRAAGRAKTVYCAFALAQRDNADNYFATFVDSGTLYNSTIWIGDASVVGVLTDVSGRLMPKRLVPMRSPAPLHPVRGDLVARRDLPRVTAATGAVQVVEVGDSLAKYDPTAQSDAWFPANTFEARLRVENIRKTFAFNNIANIGVGWSEMVDPTAGTPSWVIAGTDLYYMSSGGNNDCWRGHPLKVMSGINLGLGSGNDAGGRPPDIILLSDALQPGKPAGNAAGAVASVHEMHTFMEVLLRSMARNQGRGLIELSEQSEQVLFGGSNHHREMQQLPWVKGWTLAAATPFQFSIACDSFSAQINLSGSANVWTGMGALSIALSPMPGNVFIIDVDSAVNRVRYEGRLWGRSVASTVTTSGSTLTTAAGTGSSGTLTWTAGQNQITLSSGGFAGRTGQCILLPGLDISGQTERTYINQVITDTTAVVDDFWWGTSAGHSLATFTGAVTATMGGQMFIAADAAAQADVVMTWGTNSVYRGKITGFTNANTITLSPAPPALTGQAVQFWIGRVSVPATTTTINATGTTGNLYLSFNKDVFSYRDSLTSCRFRGVVEHWGGRFYPRFTVSGSVTADFVNLYADRDVYYLPSGTISDLCGGDNNYSSGGGGGHDPSVLAERITRRVYEALDFCAA